MSTGPIPTAGGKAIWTVTPHMHEMGKQIRVGIDRAGQDHCLVDVPDWDFNWQQFYMFQEPFLLQDNDAANVRCTWDNPTDEFVRWGSSTSDEMCIAYAYISDAP